MTIIEALVQLRNDLKLWVTNNLRVKADKIYVDEQLETKANISHAHDEYLVEDDISDFATSIYVDENIDAVQKSMDTKVDKEDGKVLSSNDYTDEEKIKLGKLSIDNNNLLVSNKYTLGDTVSYFKTGYRYRKTYTFPAEESKTYYITLQNHYGNSEQKFNIDALCNNAGNRIFFTVNARPYMQASIYGKTLDYNSRDITSVAVYQNEYYHDLVVTVVTKPTDTTTIDIYSDGSFDLDSSCISITAPTGIKECEYVVTTEDKIFSTAPIVADGKVMSTNDYTNEEKEKLASLSVGDFATSTYVDEQLNTKADKATTLEGYGITDAASKAYVDTIIEGLTAEGTADANLVQAALTAHTNDKANPHGVTLSQLGVSAKATELNYVTGVSSNVQSQLNNKANVSHNHDEYLVAGDIANKADKSYVDDMIAEAKADSSSKDAVILSEAQKALATKVNKADIVNNLTTDSATQPLSAAQGKALKTAIDSITTDIGNLGGGDMMKATYDTNSNGIVDNAERLEGHAASYFATVDGLNNAISNINYPVDSVNGKTGAVVLTASDVGAPTLDQFNAQYDNFIMHDSQLTATTICFSIKGNGTSTNTRYPMTLNVSTQNIWSGNFQLNVKLVDGSPLTNTFMYYGNLPPIVSFKYATNGNVTTYMLEFDSNYQLWGRAIVGCHPTFKFTDIPNGTLESGTELTAAYGVTCSDIGALPTRLNSSHYGTTLPAAGNAGRIFFKKVSS